jgi:hypothetical protein
MSLRTSTNEQWKLANNAFGKCVYFTEVQVSFVSEGSIWNRWTAGRSSRLCSKCFQNHLEKHIPDSKYVLLYSSPVTLTQSNNILGSRADARKIRIIPNTALDTHTHRYDGWADRQVDGIHYTEFYSNRLLGIWNKYIRLLQQTGR